MGGHVIYIEKDEEGGQEMLIYNLQQQCYHQRWSEYNTNVLEYEYDYFEHVWVRVLRKQMYSSTITLQYTRVQVRLLSNISMITFMITLMNILFLT